MNRIVSCVAAGLTMFSFTACDGLGGLGGGCPTTDNSQGTLTASIDGEAYDSCVTTGQQLGVTDGFANTLSGLAYPGVPPLPLQILITFGASAPSTIALGDGDDQGSVIDTAVDGSEVDAPAYTTDDAPEGTTDIGSVVVTRYDDNGMAGTFSFTAFTEDGESVEVTDGTFDVEWRSGNGG